MPRAGNVSEGWVDEVLATADDVGAGVDDVDGAAEDELDVAADDEPDAVVDGAELGVLDPDTGELGVLVAVVTSSAGG